MFRVIAAAVVFYSILGSASAEDALDDAGTDYLEFNVDGQTYRYSGLFAAQIINHSKQSIDVVVGPNPVVGAKLGLFEGGPRYALSWTSAIDYPLQVGVVGSRITLWLEVPNSDHALTNQQPIAVTLTHVTDDVIEGEFKGDNLVLMDTSKREVIRGWRSVSGNFRATRTYAEL
jgi:hypothetical protein